MKNERKQRSKTEELGNANNEHDTNDQKAESEDAGSGALKSDENEIGERRERTESKAQCRVDEPSTCGRVRSSKLTPALPSRPLQIIPLV